MTPEKTTEQAVNEKVGIGAYLSLAFAVVFFSGLCASSQWWGVFDFTTVNGGFGRLVSGVTEQGDAIKTAMANFRGKGGSGAIDGFMFALSLVPTVMFALAMITVFEHYGALKAARKILTPVLRPLIGIPGSAALALIASMQSTDGGAALTRQLKDGAVLFTLVAADGTLAVPVSLGLCLGVILLGKVLSANMMRLLQIRASRK